MNRLLSPSNLSSTLESYYDYVTSNCVLHCYTEHLREVNVKAQCFQSAWILVQLIKENPNVTGRSISSKIQRVSSLKDIAILTFPSFNCNVCGDSSHDSKYLQCRPFFAPNPDYASRSSLRSKRQFKDAIWNIMKCQDMLKLVEEPFWSSVAKTYPSRSL